MGHRGTSRAPTASTLTTEMFRDHFKKVSEERFEEAPVNIFQAVDEAEDLRETDEGKEWGEELDLVPSREEIICQMKKMKDSAPGEDGVRLCYLLKSGPRMMERIINLIKFMFENGREKWEDTLKMGTVIPLHKKGDRDNCNNYRGVCLLAMGSRILARVVADRLREWSEKMKLVDEDQQGFRRGRATTDATQVMMRIQEDAVDLRKRCAAHGVEMEDGEKYVASLLDLRKAYPRVNKPALWRLLSRYGLGPRCLRVLQDLHEGTEYRVRGREGVSEPWHPERGLREGCPSSPILFNIYHQAPMRIATTARKRRALQEFGSDEVGVVYHWVPGSNFPSTGNWEKTNSEAVTVTVDKSLFADDTTPTGKKKEMEGGLRVMKEVMGRFEERNNDDKEEYLEFGSPESEEIRMLGCYMGMKKDVDMRVRRARTAWFKVKKRLQTAKISKRLQARVIEACVESTILFDCQVRTWQVGEIKRLQSTVDRYYRYVWGRRNTPPLIQMQQEGRNMQDVRNELGVKSIRLKIEKRVLERIGHVFRLSDDRIVKAVTLGWMRELENVEKVPGKKRKTVLYWKKIVKEAGMDYTKIDSMTRDRKVWKAKVNERVKHLEEWEKRGGKLWNGERGERNKKVEEENVFECDVCGQICKTKGGLGAHKTRKHNTSSLKRVFECDQCREKFSQEANLKNHKKVCSGMQASSENNRKCDLCGREVSKKNYARHRTACERGRGGQGELGRGEPTAPRVYKAQRYSCECGKFLATTNRARHARTCLGGEAVPNGGENA